MSRVQRKLALLAGCGLGAAMMGRFVARQRRRIDFAGRTVLITGGSRGLGLVMARCFAAEGARVVLCARDPEELRRAEDDLRQSGTEVFTQVCDIRDEEQVTALVAAVRERFGHIDVLVNNAGIIQSGPAELMTIEDYEDALNTHFRGPLFMVEAVAPEMKRRGQGRIVNIASIGGKISVPHLLPYSASKFALVGYSEGLRGALRKFGVYVTTVCPGLMRTGSPRNALFKGQHRAEYAWFSISDSIPGLSIDAERAARQIVEACRYGDAELIVSLPAKIGVRLHGLFPGLVSDLNALVDWLLPQSGGAGTETLTGAESQSAWSPSWLTTLTEQAARRNNELQA